MRKYRELDVVTGWDWGYDSEPDDPGYPTYTTVYEDEETGLLVLNRGKFERALDNGEISA